MEHNQNQNQITHSPYQHNRERDQKREIYFAGLPKNMPIGKLIDYFNRFGEIKKASFMKNKARRGQRYGSQEHHRGCGTVEFLSGEGARGAVMYDHYYQNERIRVRYYYSPEERKEMEMAAVREKRKIHVDGVPYGFPQGKFYLIHI